MRFFLASVSLAALAVPAQAANYIASFDGTFGDSVAFSGSVTYDKDLLQTDSHAVVSYSLTSADFMALFGKATVSNSDFAHPNEYVFSVDTAASGSNGLGYDHLGFTLQPFMGSSEFFGFGVDYNYNTVSAGPTAVPASSEIIGSQAAYNFDNPPGQGGAGPAFMNYNGTVSNFTIAPAGAGAVPEPATWAMMIVGFGAIGSTMRRRRIAVSFA